MSNLVLGKGPRNPDICIVGEAPGAVEDRELEPFVGDSGELLTVLLSAAGINRSLCYLTNVVKRRPPNNEIGYYINFTKSGARTTEEYNSFVAVLKEEIEQLNPNVIVAVGNTALNALTGRLGVIKWRGSILESTLIQGKKVIPIIHPASCLYPGGYNNRYLISLDLQRVKQESITPEIVLPHRQLHTRPSYMDAMNYLEEVRKRSLTAFDIETSMSNFQITHFSVSLSPTDAMSISLSHQDGGSFFIPPNEVKIMKKICEILESDSIVKILHNAMFDTSIMYKYFGSFTWPLHDTMVAHKTIYPDLPKGLDFLASTLTREPYYKLDGKMYLRFGVGGEEKFCKYSALDAAVTEECWSVLERDLHENGFWETYLRQVKTIRQFNYAYHKGFRVNHPEKDKRLREVTNELNQLTEQFRRECGNPSINPGSPKQLAHHFYFIRGIKPYKKRVKGGWKTTTDIDALKRLARGTTVRAGMSEAKTLMEIRKLDKLRGTYLDIEYDSDMRMRGLFDPSGTNEGRKSSHKSVFGTGGNMQNQPHVIKKYFLPDEGYIGFAADFDQAENRLVAVIAPDILMLKAFADGIDIHSLTASFIFNKPIEEISKEDRSSPFGTGEQSERFWGKKANHSLNYGLGYKTFALKHEMPESEAMVICNRYIRAYSGIIQYHLWVKEALRANKRKLTNLLGRHRIFLGDLDDNLFRRAYAFIPASTVSDKITRDAIIFIDENQDIFGPFEFLNDVHDSIEGQFPLSLPLTQIADCIMRLRDSMMSPMYWKGEEVILPASAEVGFNFAGRSENNLEGLVKLKFESGSARDIAEQIKDIIEENKSKRTYEQANW